MELHTTERILVAILSGALAVFLVLGIIVLVKLLQILKHIRTIVAKAEQIADKAEHVTSFFEKTAGPAAIGKLISNIAGVVKRKAKAKNKKRKG